MDDCIFCKIIKGEIPSKKVLETENILALHDIQPAAPVHILVIPKRHISSCGELTLQDGALLAELFEGINNAAKLAGIADSGYRVVTNKGKDGGQSVEHLHFHVLGGKAFGASFG